MSDNIMNNAQPQEQSDPQPKTATKKKSKKKRLIITLIIIAAVIIGITFLGKIGYYNEGVAAWEAGDKIKACYNFQRAGGFRDAETYLEEYKAVLNEQLKGRWYAGELEYEKNGKILSSYFSLVFNENNSYDRHSTAYATQWDEDPIPYQYTIVFERDGPFLKTNRTTSTGETKMLRVFVGEKDRIKSIKEIIEAWDGDYGVQYRRESDADPDRKWFHVS
ncbi:MAG: hypothetical protein E7553_07360 [Ruminococcaceae bacterium]|nr:hypothetical protein [Oscillospiraceae bacterium]